MQLLKACAKPDNEEFISVEEMLELENSLLVNELEDLENTKSLELIETILDCIEQEGCVSKSLEIMFGENFSSVEKFEEELKSMYSHTKEGDPMYDYVIKALEHEKKVLTGPGFKIIYTLNNICNKVKELKKSPEELGLPATIKYPKYFEGNDHSWSFLKDMLEKGKTDKTQKYVKDDFTNFVDREIDSARKFYAVAISVVMNFKQFANGMWLDEAIKLSKESKDREDVKNIREVLALVRVVERTFINTARQLIVLGNKILSK